MPKLVKLNDGSNNIYRLVAKSTKNSRLILLDPETLEPVDETQSILVSTSTLDLTSIREYFPISGPQDGHDYKATWLVLPESPERWILAELMSISDEKQLARVRRRNCDYSERVPVSWLRDYLQSGGTQQVTVFDR
jgi:hypothetical protein